MVLHFLRWRESCLFVDGDGSVAASAAPLCSLLRARESRFGSSDQFNRFFLGVVAVVRRRRSLHYRAIAVWRPWQRASFWRVLISWAVGTSTTPACLP